MYFKLAISNVRKSFKDYLIYFLTLAFSVCLFYSFNSFQAQQAVLEMNDVQFELIDNIQVLMEMLSVIVAIILGFLIIYANNFLIKRRKKELGIYTLLGMKKNLISRILVYETFLIGLLSLIAGLAAGLLLSQLLTVVTANLFEVVLNYSFIFSLDATLLTIVAFAIIFFIVMIFNTFTLNRYKLIDLLTANKKNEKLRIKNIYVSIFLFVASLLLLGFAYWYALDSGYEAIMKLHIIAPAGLLGTLFFFMSLSGFLLKFVQSSKKLYYRKLNMFVLRQINASINSNYLSMSIVCIMLLFSIGALSTGVNLNRTINKTIQLTTPYDYTYVSDYHDESVQNIDSIVSDLHIDVNKLKDTSFVHKYNSDSTLSDFKSYFEKTYALADNVYENNYEVLPLSEFNTLRKTFGYDPITLSGQEAYLFSSSEMYKDIIQSILGDQQPFNLYGKKFTFANTDFDYINLGTSTHINTFVFGVVVQDEQIPKDATMSAIFFNTNLQDDVDPYAFYEEMTNKIQEYQAQYMNPDGSMQEGKPLYAIRNSMFSEFVRDNSKGLSVVMTYIGLYLGIIFLIASAVILALQQLSQASDNKERYQILNKIGAEKKMVSQSIFMQLSIYFFMPLLLGIIHSIVGIQVVNVIVQVFGKSDIFSASMMTGGIILLIYGTYFLITYVGYKNILTHD